jgi:hypothetical protein
MMTRMPVTVPSSHGRVSGRELDDDHGPATRSRRRHARAALRGSDSEELRVRLARRAGRCIHFLLGPQLGRPSPSRLQELELASAAANHHDASAKVASTAGFILGAPTGPAAAARARATLNFKFAGDLKLRPVGLGGLSHSTETVTLNLTRASGSTMSESWVTGKLL